MATKSADSSRPIIQGSTTSPPATTVADAPTMQYKLNGVEPTTVPMPTVESATKTLMIEAKSSGALHPIASSVALAMSSGMWSLSQTTVIDGTKKSSQTSAIA